MTSHDRIKAALEFRELDSIPITETAVWPDTLVRWHSEELPEGVDVRDYFRLDRISAIRAFDCSLTNVFPHTIYEETDDYVIDRNGYGVKVKYLKHHYATHIELDHAVKEHADWTRCKGALDVSDRRMATGFVEQSQEARQKGDFISLNPMDFFWFTFVMLGTENFMIQMAADPDFIHDIFETYTDFLMEMLKRTVATAIEWDAIWFYSDMAYRNGPLFSPKHYREFLLPRYRRVREFCDKHGKFLLLHTDGNVEEFMPCFIGQVSTRCSLWKRAPETTCASTSRSTAATFVSLATSPRTFWLRETRRRSRKKSERKLPSPNRKAATSTTATTPSRPR